MPSTVCFPVIINTLCEIVNMSIPTGKLPTIWKKALLKPLHKSEATDPVGSKLLEFHVHKCLYRYICDKDILCSNQSGFHRNHSCLTCLINMDESWYFAINEGNIVGSVELDFSKAFDILDQEILLNKLKLYGCDSRSLSWFRSYLSGRSQIVKIDDVISNSANIGYGIPQGSILGPLLFILYTNDLHLFIKNSRLDSYADDSNISFVSKSIKMVITNLQDDLNSITNWCNVNRMVLNVKKCNFMILCEDLKFKTRHLHLASQSVFSV